VIAGIERDAVVKDLNAHRASPGTSARYVASLLSLKCVCRYSEVLEKRLECI
jgi:hypothetical protein